MHELISLIFVIILTFEFDTSQDDANPDKFPVSLRWQ